MSTLTFESNWLKTIRVFALGLLAVLVSVPARAEGIPMPWGMWLQHPATEISTRVYNFHNLLLAIITLIVIFVFALLVIVAVRFNKRANPVPATFTHHVKLEIIWTVVPCIIVLIIAFISFPLLYASEKMPAPDLTLKVTGHQWYWSYEYPDNNISFDSIGIWNTPEVTDAQAAAAVKDAEPHWLIKEDQPRRLLEVDNRVVLPVGKVVRVDITGADVLHSWFVPSLSANRMAVTGRVNEIWFKIDKPGLYFGQCSMICGTGHGYMPIVIEGVTQDQYDAWVVSKKSAS